MDRVLNHDDFDLRQSRAFSLMALLFEAATDASKWTHFLEEFAQEFGAFAAQLLFVDETNKTASLQCLVGIDLEKSINKRNLKRYLEDAVIKDPRSPWWLSEPSHPAYGRHSPETVQSYLQGKSHHCRQIITDEEWHDSEMYREICQPVGIEYGLACFNSLSNECTLGIAFMRRAKDGPFSQADCDRLDIWSWQVERAVRVHQQLRIAEFQKNLALESLNHLAIGVCIVDSELELIFVNERARTLLAGNGNLLMEEGRLSAREKELHQQIVTAVTSKFKKGVLPISIAQETSQPQMSILVSKVWPGIQEEEKIPFGRPCATIFIARSDDDMAINFDVLQKIWGLTQREKDVLACILNGNNVTDVAAALNVTVHTVRKHLKNLFNKTNTHSKTELILLASNFAAWLKRYPHNESIA